MYKMSQDNTILEVNDYLDLFLYAKSIRDQVWQEEILTKLKNYDQKKIDQKKAVHHLWTEFRQLNNKLLELYDELKQNSNSYLEEKIMELKVRRIEISRQLQSKINPSISSL